MGKNVATYRDIEQWVKANYGWKPKTCWIAHCKELVGLPVRRAYNRFSDDRQEPCPEHKRHAIIEAFRHFGMI